MIFSSLLTYETLWLFFILSSSCILLFASKTVKYFALFSSKIHISSSALGGILLAIITSLPELVNGIVSGITNNSTLIYSNAIGANTILMFFYALFAIFFIKRVKERKESKILIKIFGMVLISIILFSLFFFINEHASFTINGHEISIIIIIQLFIYIVFFIFLIRGKSDSNEEPLQIIKTKFKNRWLILAIFFFYSSLLIISSILLNNVVTKIGEPINEGGFNLGATLAGGIFLSIATTLPEIVSMFKLMKIGLINVAIAAGIGSHMFNFTILFFTDLINKNSILKEVYSENSTQVTYIWIMYLVMYPLLINGLYNKWLKKRNFWIILNYIFICLIYILGWLIFGINT